MLKLLEKVSLRSRAGREAETVELSKSIQRVLNGYTGIEQILPEAAAIAEKLSGFFKTDPSQVFKNAQYACQKHFHQLMVATLHDHDGDLEKNPETRGVVRAIFQLSILHNVQVKGSGQRAS
jgi:hypothetical protein